MKSQRPSISNRSGGVLVWLTLTSLLKRGRSVGFSQMVAVSAVLSGVLVLAPLAGANPYTGADADHVQFFRSPSGNIGCEIDFAREGVSDGVYCMTGKPLQSIRMRSDGSLEDVCTGETCGSNGPQDQGVLPYGQSAVLGPFSCLSEEAGMTCTVNGRGFMISSVGIMPV